ncbi:LysR family transcriptional regulator [Oceanobacillus sojae]|uniref:LysR family transcriptional regulator n=1 Tax=Oceanobacillus sojae TaxID=582851 RepID=UPI0021A8DBE3|nr:LysR family transcriptional regulator [Oceanobacillus sojae]MCT1903677.1 LysR family transcriptional regulator [Oceanobacillus sojae]
MDNHLQIFITVAEKQSFSKAAEEHYMTQPAVSQYIRALEDSVGIRLLERSNKYVRLNKAGEIVYHYGKEILGLYTTMQNLVDDLVNRANGPLAIGASYTFGEYVLPRIIADMLERYPNIEPAVTIGNTAKIADLVATHQLDVGIVEGHFNRKEIIIEEFAEDEMVIVASSENKLLYKKEEIDLSDLVKETWVVRERGSGTREATEKFFQRFDITPSRLMHFSSTQSIKESVAAGLGITLLSKWAVQKEVKYGDLKIIPIKGLPFVREFSIITKSPFKTNALEIFIELLRDSKQLKTL